MIVCAHGNVADFCKEHDMVIGDRYVGDIREYVGNLPVVVTDQELTKNEYYYLKKQLLSRGTELVSVYYNDSSLSEFVVYLNQKEAEQRRQRYGGRTMFGVTRTGGEEVLLDDSRAVIERIFELRDAGMTYREIQEDRGVHHPDGRIISLSTIQVILKNREKYERFL